MRPRLRVAAALAALLALVPAAGATAAAVSGRQLHALAVSAAAGDANALRQLRNVTEVDGAPADVAGVLDTSDSAQLHARLEALASGTGPGSGAPGSSAGARGTAAAILSAGQYGKSPVPDPIGTVLHDIGKWLTKLAAGAPGGPVVFWLALGALVLALAALGARRMMRRLDTTAQAAAAAASAPGEDPALLEQAASDAEQRGAFGDAVRLRFKAGLLSLGARSAIDYRPSLLTGDVARRLHSREFDALAATFERVAYGGAPAGEADATAARDGWRALLSGRAER